MPEELRRWLVLLRIPLALLGIVLFFGLYNHYLIDTNLRNLRNSLSILDKAAGAGQAEAALLLVDQALNSQMAEEAVDLQNLTTLQYAQGTLAQGQRERPVADTQAMLSVLEEERALNRPGVLSTLDGVVTGVQNAWKQTSLLPRQVLGDALSGVMDEARFEKAIRLEGTGHGAEAAQLFEALLKEYPHYRGRVSLKLRAGYLYQKMQDLTRARRLYQQALGQARSLAETDTAQQMLQNLEEVQVRRKGTRALETRLARAGSALERQETAFELGSLWIRLSDMSKAAEAFHEAHQSDPGGRLALSARFKEAWCLRYSGRLEDALVQFVGIAQQNPKSNWAATAYQQIAEIYRASGDTTATAQVYEQALAQGGEDAVTAVLYVQTGSTYRYDLKDPQKAEQFFLEAQMKYPASAFSGVPKKQEEITGKSGAASSTSAGRLSRASSAAAGAPAAQPPASLTAASLSEGSPLMTWLEGFLPVFVDVFADRLAKYMQAAGEPTLTRRFTDVEFRDLVARQVQQRFPGQVSGIQARIHSDGYTGSGTVRLGLLTFPVQLKLSVKIVNERPNAVLQEITVGKFPIPKVLLSYLEKQVNASVQKTNYPLKVKQYDLREGYALISVELARN